MPMFLVPKPNNEARLIIDYSSCPEYIVTPRFSLRTAGEALRIIPGNSLIIKIDLKSGFHQLPLHPEFLNHNGMCYRGEKLSLTRLPMGHALALEICYRVS